MCFYFLFNLGETNKRVGGKNQCLPPLIITLVFRVGLYWKIPICGLQKMRNYCLSPSFDSSTQHLALLVETLKVSHSFSLLATNHGTNPHLPTRLRTRVRHPLWSSTHSFIINWMQKQYNQLYYNHYFSLLLTIRYVMTCDKNFVKNWSTKSYGNILTYHFLNWHCNKGNCMILIE